GVGMNTKTSLLRFDVFVVSLEALRGLREHIAAVRGHDPDLCRQLRKAATSVSLNVAEGRRRRGGDKTHLWRVASGSADEIIAALLSAEALGYLEMDRLEDTLDLLDRVQAMLWRLTHPRP
ncbi:MAG: four helix bundle protein, partial [bacterium]|nr:four helix bundle protein [bacterium]